MIDSHLWADKYAAQWMISLMFRKKFQGLSLMHLRLNSALEDKNKLRERLIDNAFAYDRYLKTYAEIVKWSKERIGFGLRLLEEGIDITGPNAIIYAGMALAYFQFANIGIAQEENFRKSEEFVQKALVINPELTEAHFVYGNIFTLSDPHKAIRHYNKAYKNKPSPEIIQWFSWCAFLSENLILQFHCLISI